VTQSIDKIDSEGKNIMFSNYDPESN